MIIEVLRINLIIMLYKIIIKRLTIPPNVWLAFQGLEKSENAVQYF